jgi:hypothetical protein
LDGLKSKKKEGSMRLKPLEQFVCDTCGEVIESPDEGYIEWVDDKKAVNFNIVHHSLHSPLKPSRSCYQHENAYGRSDTALRDFLGAHGIVEMLSFIDVGDYHQRDYRGPTASDLREWTEVARRLFIPHYEEARLYWDRARADGFFEGANELWPYLPSTLELLIERYGEET